MNYTTIETNLLIKQKYLLLVTTVMAIEVTYEKSAKTCQSNPK